MVGFKTRREEVLFRRLRFTVTRVTRKRSLFDASLKHLLPEFWVRSRMRCKAVRTFPSINSSSTSICETSAAVTPSKDVPVISAHDSARPGCCLPEVTEFQNLPTLPSPPQRSASDLFQSRPVSGLYFEGLSSGIAKACLAHDRQMHT